MLRGAFLSTTPTGTGTGSGGASRTTQMYDRKYEMVKVAVAVVGTMAMVSVFTAVVVHHLDEREMASEIARVKAQAKAEVARVEGQARL